MNETNALLSNTGIHNDENTYFFEVTEESDWIVFHADCGHPIATWNLYVVRDPLGRIRYQHLDVNCPRTITIHRSELKTSLNAIAGPIPEGRWRIDFAKLPPLKFYFEAGKGHLHSDFFDFRPIFPDPNRDIWVDLPAACEPFAYNLYDWDASRKSGNRWYRGDCHLHSILSDGSLCPDQLNAQALQNGLEFIIVTDHLLFPTSWPKTELLVIPGIEVTTVAGHWNALGPHRWFDWHPSAPDGGMTTEAGMNRSLHDGAEAGAVRNLNHPMHKDFHWTFHETDLRLVDTLEIINAPQNRNYKPGNAETLAIWSTLWNEGYTIPGTGGSDFHFNAPFHEDGEEQRLGDPSTYVYADELSANKILEGIRGGNTYVSRGPVLDIEIEVGGQNYPPGSNLTEAVKASTDGFIHYRVEVTGLQAGQLCWIEAGKQVEVGNISGQGIFEKTFDWKERDYAWARVDIRDSTGEVVAFVNPVYCGVREPEIQTWAEAVVKTGLVMLDLKEPGGTGW